MRDTRARFRYLDVLGGPNVGVSVGDDDRVDILARSTHRGSELVIVATSARIADATNHMLADLDIAVDGRRRVIEEIREALTAITANWHDLQRDYPARARSALDALRPGTRHVRSMVGCAIRLDHPPSRRPQFAASIETTKSRFTTALWLAGTGVFDRPTIAIETTKRDGGWCGRISDGLDLTDLIWRSAEGCGDLVSHLDCAPDCDLGCDVGCL